MRRKVLPCPNSSVDNHVFFSRRGFTLLEVLIAFAVTSVLLTALYSTFALSHRALGVIDESLLKLQESRFFVDTLKREIESGLYSADKNYSFFKMDDRDYYGRQTSQLFITCFSPLVTGLSRINYTVEERNGNLVIKKHIIPAFSEPLENKGVDMLEEIESFTLEARSGDSWVKTWDSTLSKSIPDEVRISVTILIRNKDKREDCGTPFFISDIARPRIGKKI
ncbi:MAG: prepilin-type N-terminal cleavage/methylation domain-containing protein [Syntrophales bacterium]